MTETQADTIDELRDELSGVDSLADTPFSELFHVARTSSKHVHTGVSLPVRIDGGGVEVGSPVKTERGQRFRTNADWDTTISLPVRPFMTVDVARQEIRRQLRDVKRHALPAN